MLLNFFPILLAVKFIAGCREDNKFDVAFRWNFINYTWDSHDDLKAAMSCGTYVPGTDIIAGIKIYKDIIYLSLPRVKKSARVTLASIPLRSTNTENLLLTPFPSWKMNSGEDCEAFQDVQSMEIDTEGIMWVLDARRVGQVTACPPRIVLLDLNRGGVVVQDYMVPDELCPHARGCFLNDIVVDGDFAYMSDTTIVDPGIFVYNRKLDRGWKVRDASMHGDPSAAIFVGQGARKTAIENINGVALSPDCRGPRRFYFMPHSSFHIFSIDTLVLKRVAENQGNVSEHIVDHGTKLGQSGGMICDEKGDIYYGLLPLDAVVRWRTNKPLEESEIVEKNSETIKWPDSFSFDSEGNLYLVTNSYLFFSKTEIDLSQINFRIIKLRTCTNSYFFCNTG